MKMKKIRRIKFPEEATDSETVYYTKTGKTWVITWWQDKLKTFGEFHHHSLKVGLGYVLKFLGG